MADRAGRLPERRGRRRRRIASDYWPSYDLIARSDTTVPGPRGRKARLGLACRLHERPVMNRLVVRAPILAALLVLAASSGCGDSAEPDTRSPTAGASGQKAESGAGGAAGHEPDDYVVCPTEPPMAGEPCRQENKLCQYKRSGPCPPNPDQLRVCRSGKWIVTGPTIACEGRARDAGQDTDSGQDAGE